MSFLISRGSHLDVEIQENEAPCDTHDPSLDSSYVYFQREDHSNLDNILDLVDPVEAVRTLDMHRDAPPTKRRPTCLRETL